MGYILHHRKVIEVQEPTGLGRILFNDQHSRAVLLKCPPEFEELRFAAVSIFESTKSNSVAIEKITQLSKVAGFEVHLIIPVSTSVCLGTSGEETHYERKWANQFYNIVSGDRATLAEDKLHFVGWSDQAVADFLASRFAYDSAKGERANFEGLNTFLGAFGQLGAIRTHVEHDLEIPSPVRFTQKKGSPAPFDCVVKEDEILQKALLG
jgi:hypothetical protein